MRDGSLAKARRREAQVREIWALCPGQQKEEREKRVVASLEAKFEVAIDAVAKPRQQCKEVGTKKAVEALSERPSQGRSSILL